MSLLTFDTINGFLSEAAAKLPPEAPIGACVMATYDPNSSFAFPSRFFTDFLQEATKTHRFFFILMNDGDLSKALNSLPLEKRKIDFLTLLAHGDRNGFCLSGTEGGYIRSSRIKDLDLSSLSPRVNIVFHCCKAGISIMPAFQAKLPEASLWGSRHSIINAFLLPSEPDKLRILIFNLKNEKRDVIYPKGALKPETAEEWMNEIGHTPAMNLFLALAKDFKRSIQSHSGITKKECLDLLRPHADEGDFRALERLGEAPPKEPFESLLKGDMTCFSTLRDDPTFFSKIRAHVLTGNRIAATCYLTLLAEDLACPFNSDEITPLLITLLDEGFELSLTVIEKLIHRIDLTPYLELLEKNSPAESWARHLLFLHYSKIGDREKITYILLQGQSEGDSWAFYETGLSLIKSAKLDEAAKAFIKSKIPEGNQKLISIVDESGEASFYLFSKHPNNLVYLYKAAYLGHGRALELLETYTDSKSIYIRDLIKGARPPQINKRSYLSV